MSYIPVDPDVKKEMLEAVGAGSVDDLFAPIPPELSDRAFELPEPLSEQEVYGLLAELSDRTGDACCSFVGAGAYDHYIPAAVHSLVNRGEFYTAYTPYQPEVSQGTLTATFEFQTYVVSLTGMDVANASMYDGATAVAEAVLMAMRITKGRAKALVAANVHPEYAETIDTYLRYLPDAGAVSVPFGADGLVDVGEVTGASNDDVACLVVQYPNFFGLVSEPLAELADAVHAAGALLIVVTNPMALTVLTPPGDFGADIVVGEGQPFGIPISAGGPGLGFFATTMDNVRQMPGRLVGRTTDADGRPAYALVLQTREQHIRREKATSNICSNHALMATAFAVYASLMGESGLKALGRLNLSKAAYARERIAALDGYELVFAGPVFNEFVVRCPGDAAELRARCRETGVDPGLPLGRFYPDMADCLLVAVTEKRAKGDIDRLVEALGKQNR
ncbi:MAG: aminomethyl-transferring glycine dehydrogenase subunit GcvPA [Candidatus Coatesbacteria bacterium]|nr:MAG: aminomethyl-transferring glycine dehydrogenase subunit GcvPA [Candidatus Coatesbacteria bacterium]